MVDTVKTAVDRCSKGADPSKVVAELAIEKDMTTEQAARICEAVNKIASINYLSDKNNDREADFPLANSAAVVKMMKDTYKIAKEPFHFRKTASEGLGNTNNTLDKMKYVTDEERKRYEDSYARANYSAGWMDVQRATQSLKLASDEERLATYKLHEDFIALANKCASLSDEDAQDMANYTVYTYGKDGLNFLTALENLTERPYDKSYRPFMKTGSDIEKAVDLFMFNADQLMGLRDTLGVFKEASDTYAVKEAGKGGKKGEKKEDSSPFVNIPWNDFRASFIASHPNANTWSDRDIIDHPDAFKAWNEAAKNVMNNTTVRLKAQGITQAPTADEIVEFNDKRNKFNWDRQKKLFETQRNRANTQDEMDQWEFDKQTERMNTEKGRHDRAQEMDNYAFDQKYQNFQTQQGIDNLINQGKRNGKYLADNTVADWGQQIADNKLKQQKYDSDRSESKRQYFEANPNERLTAEEEATLEGAKEKYNADKWYDDSAHEQTNRQDKYDIDTTQTRHRKEDLDREEQVRDFLRNNPSLRPTTDEEARDRAEEEKFKLEKSQAAREDWHDDRTAKAQQKQLDQQKDAAREAIYRSHFGSRAQSADVEKARMDAEEEIWRHRDLAKQRRDKVWGEIGKGSSAANKWLDDIKTEAINNVKSSYNAATGLFKYLDAARKALQGPQLSGNEYSNPLSLKASKYLDNLGLHDTFAKAYLSDPYLRQYSPKEVAEAFNIVHEVAPDIITKNASPHVVSAMIRKYLASNNQIDPIEVRDLVSTEKDRAQTDLTKQQLENLKRTKPNK